MLNIGKSNISAISILILLFFAPLLSSGKTLYVSENNNPELTKSDDDSILVFKSIEAATSMLKSGDTLILSDGIYRESIILPNQIWDESKATRIIAEHVDKVVIKGSDIVKGWKRLNDTTYYIDNWKYNSQQVFVDGEALQQIGGVIFGGYPSDSSHKFHSYFPKSSIWPARIKHSRGQLPTKSFYYNLGNQVLMINPGISNAISSHTVEVSTRPHLVYGKNSHGVQIVNIKFQHSNTSDNSRAGAITLRGTNILLNNISITWTDSVGLNLSGANNKVINSKMNFCGQLGMKVRGKNVLIKGNETSRNNTRGFNKWWEAGGAKFVGENGLQDSLVSDHLAAFNHGDGIWIDWGNRNVEIKHSTAAYNEGFGIHYEASQNGFIHHNIAFSNNQRGIYAPHSSGNFISNNLVAFNKLAGIIIIDEQRRDPKNVLDLEPRNNSVFANVIAWNGPNRPTLIIPDPKLGTKSDHNLYISDSGDAKFATDWPSRLSVKSTDNFDAWRRKTEFDRHSTIVAATPDPIITAAISRRSLVIDWSTLINITKKYRIKFPDEELKNIYRTGEHDPVLFPGPFEAL